MLPAALNSVRTGFTKQAHRTFREEQTIFVQYVQYENMQFSQDCWPPILVFHTPLQSSAVVEVQEFQHRAY